jgi:hypothetical protein
MSVRAKFQLSHIEQNAWNKDDRKLVFTPQYDQAIPEDQAFAKFTPSGRFEMNCNNPAALEQLELGKYYYFDITPCEENEG